MHAIGHIRELYFAGKALGVILILALFLQTLYGSYNIPPGPTENRGLAVICHISCPFHVLRKAL